MSLLTTKYNEIVRFKVIDGDEKDEKNYDFECDRLTVSTRMDTASFELGDDTLLQYHGKFWLFYSLRFRSMKRTIDNVAHDLIDLLNDMKNPDNTVRFYPIYSINSTFYYVVGLNMNNLELVKFERMRQDQSRTLQVRNKSGIDTLPSAFRTNRYINPSHL